MVKSRVTVFVEATSAVRRNATVIDNGQHAAIMPTRQFSGPRIYLPRPVRSRRKPGRLVQTHTRSINRQLCTNVEANMRRCRRARNPHADVGASVCMHPNTSTLVCLIHHRDIQDWGVGRGKQEVQCGGSSFSEWRYQDGTA